MFCPIIRKSLFLLIVLLAFSTSDLLAQDWQDPALDYIGQTPAEAIAAFGAPQQVFVQRGTEARLDMVVYYYQADHFYLFWWQSRMWQFRFDRRYQGNLFGLSMGMPKNAVLNALGPPSRDSGGELVYRLPEDAYPVNVRLIFEADRLADLYVYRADF